MAAPPPRPRSRPDDRVGFIVLPSDALYEILLRLPTKDLCRLRAVCRAWHSLLSDPHFAAAHAAHHRESLLIVVGYDTTHQTDGVLCDIMDISGRIVKSVRAATGDDDEAAKDHQWKCVMYTLQEVLCVMKDSRLRWQVINLATGATRALPEGLAAEHSVHALDILNYYVTATFGMVTSIGECKVLRVFRAATGAQQCRHLCEVLALDGSNQPIWRAKKAPPYYVSLGEWAVVVLNGIVYIRLLDPWNEVSDRCLVASYDLETEECVKIVAC